MVLTVTFRTGKVYREHITDLDIWERELWFTTHKTNDNKHIRLIEIQSFQVEDITEFKNEWNEPCKDEELRRYLYDGKTSIK